MTRHRKGLAVHQAWNDCNIDVTFDFAGEEPDEETICLAIEGLIAQLRIEQALHQTGREDRSSIVDVVDLDQRWELTRPTADAACDEGGDPCGS